MLLDDTAFDSGTSVITTKHITTEYLTKFECARVLGVRSQMLIKGAPSTLPKSENIEGMVEFEIAKRELMAGLCPIIIGRPLPNGEKILIPVSKLIVKCI